MSEREVAEKYGVSEKTVLTRLRAMGTEMRKGYETNRRVSDDHIGLFVQECERGLSSVEIGEKYGIDIQSTEGNSHLGDFSYPKEDEQKLIFILDRYLKD